MQYLTLLFIGCISASSLRGFLKNMSKVRCRWLVRADIRQACSWLLAVCQRAPEAGHERAPVTCVGSKPGSC